MDHLLLPKHPISIPSRVEYVCEEEEPFDRGDFATYPIRVGWPALLTSHTGVPLWYSCQSVTINQERLRSEEKVLMSWVFFGLLHTALSPFGLYKAQDYVEGDSITGRRWLHTKALEDILSDWHDAMRATGPEQRTALLVDLRRCFELAQEALIALNQTPYNSFDRMIKASLFAVCNTIEGMIIAWSDDNIDILSPVLPIKCDDVSRKTMLQNGWCPSEIAHWEARSVTSWSGIWFAQHVQKNQLNQSHSDCSESGCNRLQIKLDVYRPRHVEESCECELLGPNTSRIVDCLRDGDIPVLEVKRDAIDVHALKSLDSDAAYVAISHVWADGLGNPRQMSLPQCQVMRLNHLVQQIRLHTFYSGKPGQETKLVHKKRVFLWCDTLCCPVEPHLKPLALARMRDVYEKADFTLVLDREMQCYNYSDIGVIEAGWRIITSRWAKRLWTYQEAGLALRLLVQFADAPVSVYPIMQAASRMHKEGLRRDRLYEQVCAELVMLRKWKHGEPGTAWISDIVTGLAHRTVSVASDQALCLATVLGLDGGRIAQASPDEGMRLVWRLICQHERGVAETIIFNTLGRMNVPGFRWAPESFLQSVQHNLDFISFEDDRKAVALLTHGLRVRRSGWRIRLASRPKGLAKDFCAPVGPQLTVMPARHPDGTCYNILKLSQDGIAGPQNCMLETLADDSQDWFIILKQDHAFKWSRWHSQQRGVLVSKELHECGLSYFRSHMLVDVDRLEPRLELSRQVDFIYSRVIRQSWTMRALNFLMHLETAVSTAFAWVSEVARKTAMAVLQPILLGCGHMLGSRLVRMITLPRSEVLKLPAAAKLSREAAWSESTDSLGVDIIPAMTGRYVDIEEVFDASTEWVVD